MTDEELKQLVREQIAKEYWEIHYSLSSEAFTWVKAKLTNEDIGGAYNFADAILALKKPDGTPAIGIISDDQLEPTIHETGNYLDDLEALHKEYKIDGFVRLVGGKDERD